MTQKLPRNSTILTCAIFLLSTAISGVALAADPGATAKINYNDPQQVVDGFGFSTAWNSLPGSPENEDAFFSTTKGAGFSILRNRIPFNEGGRHPDNFMAKDSTGHYVYTAVTDAKGSYKNFQLDWNNWDLQATRSLIDRVKANPDDQLAKVFSTPWTPPNNSVERWKHTTDPSSKSRDRLTEKRYTRSPQIGGYLKPEHYQDYADVLADYVLGFKQNMGVDLYALSLQNEPGFDAGYESCDWNAQQIHDFLLVLKQEFDRKAVWTAFPSLKIMAPEDNEFRETLLNAVYDDPATRDLLGISAAHQYNYGRWQLGGKLSNLFTARDTYHPDPFRNAFQYGKPVWMTEWSPADFAFNPKIREGLIDARMMHQDFTVSHLDAFVYWWSQSLLIRRNGKTQPNKDLWAMAQYSRFIRPGWKVLSATSTPANGVYLTAFSDSPSNQIAIVLVNTNTAPKTIALNVAGVSSFQKLELFRTSDKEDMADIGPINTDGVNGVATLSPSSISTCYGFVSR